MMVGVCLCVSVRVRVAHGLSRIDGTTTGGGGSGSGSSMTCSGIVPRVHLMVGWRFGQPSDQISDSSQWPSVWERRVL